MKGIFVLSIYNLKYKGFPLLKQKYLPKTERCFSIFYNTLLSPFKAIGKQNSYAHSYAGYN